MQVISISIEVVLSANKTGKSEPNGQNIDAEANDELKCKHRERERSRWLQNGRERVREGRKKTSSKPSD